MSIVTESQGTFWDPKNPGDTITGRVVSIDSALRSQFSYKPSEDGPKEVFILELAVIKDGAETGEGVSVWTWAKVLHGEMLKAQPQTGEVITCTYVKDGFSKQYKKAYQVFTVVVAGREPKPFAWGDHSAGIPDDEADGDEPAADDGIPF